MNSIRRKISKIIPANLKLQNYNLSKIKTKKSLISFYEINLPLSNSNSEKNIDRTSSIKMQNSLTRKGKSIEHFSPFNSMYREKCQLNMKELLIKQEKTMKNMTKILNGDKLIEVHGHNNNSKKNSMIINSRQDNSNFFFPNEIQYKANRLKDLNSEVKHFFEIDFSKIKKFKKKYTNKLNKIEEKGKAKKVLSLTIMILEDLVPIIPSLEEELIKLSILLKQTNIGKRDYSKYSVCLAGNSNLKHYFDIPKDDQPKFPNVNEIKIDLKNKSKAQNKIKKIPELIERSSGTNIQISTSTQTKNENVLKFNTKNNGLGLLSEEENSLRRLQEVKLSVKRKGTDVKIPKLCLNNIKLNSPDFNEEFLSNLKEFSDSWRELSCKLK